MIGAGLETGFRSGFDGASAAIEVMILTSHRSTDSLAAQRLFRKNEGSLLDRLVE